MLRGLLLVLCVALSQAVAAEVIHGKVVSVLDGDTLIILGEGRVQHRIRLAEIDAPEIGHGSGRPGQPYGQKSKESLADLVAGKQVSASCPTSDKYARRICHVSLENKDINLEQVRRGMAMVYRQYARTHGYYAAELDARLAGYGLWRDEAPIPPWEWRRQKNQFHSGPQKSD